MDGPAQGLLERAQGANPMKQWAVRAAGAQLPRVWVHSGNGSAGREPQALVTFAWRLFVWEILRPIENAIVYIYLIAFSNKCMLLSTTY